MSRSNGTGLQSSDGASRGIPPRGLGTLVGAPAAVVMAMACLVAPGPAGDVLAWAWLGANALLAIGAVVWAVSCPRCWLCAASSVWRWGFWVALGASAVGYAAGGSALVRLAGEFVPPSLLLVTGLGLFPVLFCATVLLGLCGSAVCAFTTRAAVRPPIVRAAPGGWWLATLALVLLDGLLQLLGASPFRSAAVLGGVPVVTAAICRGLLRSEREPEEHARRLVSWMVRHLVLHPRFGSRRGVVDLRGPGIGLLVGAVVIAIEAMGLLAPMQASVLGVMVRMRASMHQQLLPGGLPRPPPAGQGEVTILDMNPLVRRAALTTGSEASVQTEVIRKLVSLDTRCIVLPMPVLTLPSPHGWHSIQDAPAPMAGDIDRTLRDMPELIATVRSAGNVMVTGARAYSRPTSLDVGVPDRRVLRLANELVAAAAASCAGDLPTISGASLPTIPMRWDGAVPAPVWLFSAAHGTGTSVRQVPGRPDEARLAGTAIPLIGKDRVLVDFETDDPDHDFVKVAYSSVLSNEPVMLPHGRYARTIALQPSRWTDAATFFRGRIVFLDSITNQRCETPVGVVTPQNVLAHGTVTLMRGLPVGRLHPVAFAAIVLGIGALLGLFCGRRSPLEAGWRAAAVMFVLSALSVYAFVAWSVWIDVVAPGLAVAASFLLTTQLTFALERRGREVNRALLERFVAPEVVEELLDDPETKLGLGGKRQRVCILFADLRDFTGFAERHTPEEVIEVVNVFMTALTEVLHRHRGLLDKYTGDGLMAIFRMGDHEREDVMRAVRAALDMRSTAIRIADEQAAAGRDRLGVGIGVHFGEAVVGLVGNPKQFNYTALGHTVVVAERLQEAAQAGEVLVSDTVDEFLCGRFETVAREPMAVRGASEPVRPYSVIGGDCPEEQAGVNEPRSPSTPLP